MPLAPSLSAILNMTPRSPHPSGRWTGSQVRDLARFVGIRLREEHLFEVYNTENRTRFWRVLRQKLFPIRIRSLQSLDNVNYG